MRTQKHSTPIFRLLLAAILGLMCAESRGASGAPAKPVSDAYYSPTSLAVSSDGTELYIACATSGQVLALETGSLQIKRSIAVPGKPTGLALSTDGRQLFVTCAALASQLAVIDLKDTKAPRLIPLGHTAMCPTPAPDGKTVYVCNRFNNEVAVVDLAAGKMAARIPVDREPISAAVTPDGKYLLVANHLHSGRANADVVAARVSLIETASGKVLRYWQLPNGSGQLREVRISPDGRFACVTHVLSRFHLPTTQLDRGWMNSNALTLIDLTTMTLINTVLLDNVDRGAAYPWAAGWSADGKTIFVTHAGTHELSVIDFPGLMAKLAKLPEKVDDNAPVDYNSASRVKADVPNDLAFLVGVRERVQLKGKGPRAVALSGSRVYVANYFSDTIDTIDRQKQPVTVTETRLGPERPMTVLRRGEFFFNDASICFQGWQSCASCHSDDGRVDGLNWDLLNDGIGNPKNSKSMLLSHRTPPAMSMGARDNAEAAVRAGIRHILFTVQPEEVPTAIDEWLKSLKPIPSPHLENDKLSASAKRGQKLFLGKETRCATCHPPGLFTDLKHHDVGTVGEFDKPSETFDSPTLVEIWRTAPYLHDGSAANLREVLLDHNRQDRHGKTSHLSPREIDDLTAYLLSL